MGWQLDDVLFFGSGGVTPPPVTQIPLYNNGTSGQYCTTGSPIVMSGDFVLTFTLRVYTFDNFRGIAYDSAGSPAYILLHTNNDIQIGNFAGLFLIIPNSAFPDQTSRVIRLERSGIALTASVDGTQQAAGTVNSSDIVLDVFGQRAGGFANVSIYNIVLDDGSVHSYPCNDTFANDPVMLNEGNGGNGTYTAMTAASWINE